MKKIVLFTFAVLLAAASYCVAEELADLSEEIDAGLAAIQAQNRPRASQIENVRPNVLAVPRAENARPGAVKAPQAVTPRKAQRVQNAQVKQGQQYKQNPPKYDHPLTRQEIRSMDILDRPNRPGHFYGNTVRRRHGR